MVFIIFVAWGNTGWRERDVTELLFFASTFLENAVFICVEQFEAPGKHKYKYNGREWQGDFGYNMYDMPLRDYDPAIGRWVVLDPVIHHSQSTYSSFNGNPVLFADPTGGKGQMLDENGARKYDDNGNYIWRGDRVAPGEVSMAAYLGGGGATTAPTAEDVKKNEGILVISTLEELFGFIVSNPNISLEDLKPKDDPQQEGKNAELARYIASKYGYDCKEVEKFLDNNPFVPTSKGVSFAGYEAVSSKNKKGKIDKAAEKGAIKGFEFFIKKILGTPFQFVLKPTTLGNPEKEEVRKARFVDCQMRLIDLVFRKPVQVLPVPQRSLEHSSIYDKLHFRYY